MNPNLPEIILSYDVSMAVRSRAASVSHLIFGRKDVKDNGHVPYVRRPGVVWIGQSVLIMPAQTAWELVAKLRALGATVATARIRIDRAELQPFRDDRTTNPVNMLTGNRGASGETHLAAEFI